MATCGRLWGKIDARWKHGNPGGKHAEGPVSAHKHSPAVPGSAQWERAQGERAQGEGKTKTPLNPKAQGRSLERIYA